jgi:alpha-L-fucosidase
MFPIENPMNKPMMTSNNSRRRFIGGAAEGTVLRSLTARVMALAVLLSNTVAAKDKPDADARNGLAVWQSYKYGMFIHFGMATFTGRADENDPRNAAEPSTLYAPTDLDVDQWIKVARDAGMKYAVLTAKHTAGHCLWDSKVQFRGKEFEHDVATSGNPADVVAGFVSACRKYGVAPGLYWCLLDFHNNSVPPGSQWRAGRLPDDYYRFTQDQLTELIRCYPEVGYYWLDIPRAASGDQRRTIHDMIKRLRPGTVVLFNHGTEPPDGALTIETCQAAWPTDVLNTERHPCKPGQFTPEQTWQGKTFRMGYEHCDCLARHWFWEASDTPRQSGELHAVYRDVIAAGGNLLLNVAPDKTGRIPDSSVSALMELKKAIDGSQD